MDPTKNKQLAKRLEIQAARKAKKDDPAIVPAEELRKAFTDRIFAKATDWVIELSPAVHLRHSCNTCHEFPVRSCDFVRVSDYSVYGGSQSSCEWHVPCCGRRWRWGTDGATR
eukprot:3083116-Lingulodinium_polyedra.AAC.1